MSQLVDKFKERKFYDEIITPTENPDLPSLYTKNFLDSWNIFPLYGKVDTLGIPIMPKPYLTDYCSFVKDKKQVKGIYPIKNFFNFFRDQYLDYYALGAFNKETQYFFSDLPPIKGYIDVDLEYVDKISELYTDFANLQKGNNKTRLAKVWGNNSLNKIKNFQEFIDELLNFLSYQQRYFTRAGYVESVDYSLLHTGLAIDIYDGDPDNEELRRSFATDINFEAYKELCIRSNLKIDRHAPWRLILDVRTKKNNKNNKIPYGQMDFESSIKQYIPYFKKIQDFFDFFYVKAIPYDKISFVYFEEFINLIDSMYDSFIFDFPNYKLYFINFCGKAKVIQKTRNSLPNLKIEEYFDLYLKIRNIELSKIVDKNILDNITQETLNVYKQNELLTGVENSIITAIKYYTTNIGSFAYYSPSLYELDEKSKMP